MKKLIIAISLLGTFTLWSQTDYFAKKGVAIKGYDVTEYFNNKALKGTEKFSSKYDGTVFHFVSNENKEKFEAAPEQFVPQYGGYCAYAVGLKEKKVSIDPETFEIRDGKLYLFYNKFGTNTLDLWNEQNPEELKAKADAYWSKNSQK